MVWEYHQSPSIPQISWKASWWDGLCMGNDESMINSSTIPEANLYTQHNILSFHYVRSMISQGYINLQHLSSESNFTDILRKNWSYQSSYYELIQPVFHHSWNTAALILNDKTWLQDRVALVIACIYHSPFFLFMTQHLASELNFADVLTKNWSYQTSHYELIQPVFYHSGNTTAFFLDNTLELDISIAEGPIFSIFGEWEQVVATNARGARVRQVEHY